MESPQQLPHYTTADVVILLDHQLKVLDTNELHAERFGLSREEMIGKSIFDFLPDDAAQRRKRYVEKVFTSGLPYFGTDHREDKWHDVAIYPVLDSSGTIHKVAVYAKDITDRVKKEQALRERELIFRSLFMNSPISLFIHDKESGEIIEANEAAWKANGCRSLEELKKEGFWMPPPYSARDALELIRKTSLGEKLPPYEWLSRKKDGSLLWEEIYLTPIILNGIERVLAAAINITKRKASLEHNQLLAGIIDRSIDFIGIADAAKNVLYVNPAGREMLGIGSEEEARKTNIQEYFMPEDLPFIHSEIFPELTSKGRWTGEFRFRHFQTKQAIDVDYDLFRSIDPHTGEITHISTVSRDITESKRIQDQIRKSEEDHRNLITRMQLGLAVHKIILDDNGTPVDYIFLDINPAFERFTGLKKEDVIGKRVLEILPKTEDIWIQNFGKVALTGESITFEDYSRELNKYYNVVAYQPQHLHFAVLVEDITKRKRDQKVRDVLYEISRSSLKAKTLEEILHTVRKQLGNVLDTSNFIVARYHSDGNVFSKIMYEDEKEDFESWKAENSLSGRVVESGKTLLLRKEDISLLAKEHKADLVGNPAACWLGVPINLNETVFGIIIIQHYSDENAFNDEDAKVLEMIANDLSVIIQRSEMIEHLVKAREKAEESDRLKSAFLANVSHEIRTPMNGILGFLDLLSDANLLEDTKQQYISIVQKSGERLLATINDIIEISRLDTGQAEIHQEKLNLNDLICFLLDFFKPQINAKGLQMLTGTMLESRDAWVVSDKSKLHSILMNLLKNAIKFTDEGSIELGSYLEESDLFVYVQDSGIGIAADQLERIFQAFVQADTSLARPYEGSGLGLSICKSFAELLGGDIRAESMPGKGSRFTLRIPYVPAN